MSKQSRNILIGGIVAVVLVAALAFLIGRGCEDDDGASTTRSTPTTATGTTTSTTPTTTQEVATVTVPTPPPPPPPTPPPDITSRSVDPEVADPGDPLTFSAEVMGAAASVTVSVYKRGTGDLALTLPLVRGATVGVMTTWSASASAPAEKGVYRYYASAVGEDGTVVEMPGVSGWTFCIGDPLVDCT